MPTYSHLYQLPLVACCCNGANNSAQSSGGQPSPPALTCSKHSIRYQPKQWRCYIRRWESCQGHEACDQVLI